MPRRNAAFEVAMDADPDAAVRYYGPGIPSLLDRGEQIHHPVLFRIGDED